MGKGDKRSRRGKLFKGSYGKARPHKPKRPKPGRIDSRHVVLEIAVSTPSSRSRSEREAALEAGAEIAQAPADAPPLHLVDARRANADALRSSEERFRLLAEAAFEGVGVSEELVWLDVSQQFADMLGYAREELIGTHVSKVVAPESLDRVLHHVDIGYEYAYEVTGLCKDGSRIPVEVRGRTMQVGERRVRVSAVRDITEQKRIREELESQQQRLRALAAALASRKSASDASLPGICTMRSGRPWPPPRSSSTASSRTCPGAIARAAART